MKRLIPILILFMACRTVHLNKSSEAESLNTDTSETYDSVWVKKHVDLNSIFQAGNVHIHIGLSQKKLSQVPVIPGKDPLSQLIEAAVRSSNQQATGIDITVGSLSNRKSFQETQDTGHLKASSTAHADSATKTTSKAKDSKSPFGVALAAVLLIVISLALYFIDRYFSTARKAVDAGVDLIKKI